MKALDTRVYYNYRKRDDDSSHITFAAPDPTEREPFSYRKNNWGFDANWWTGTNSDAASRNSPRLRGWYLRLRFAAAY